MIWQPQRLCSGLRDGTTGESMHALGFQSLNAMQTCFFAAHVEQASQIQCVGVEPG